MSDLTVILANGDFPRRGGSARRLLQSARRVVACDGAADLYRGAFGRDPDVIVGDLDSIAAPASPDAEVVRVAEQDTNDLTKAITLCRGRGWTELVIVGATGKREDHTLGNIFRAMEAGVQVVTDCGRFIPFECELKLELSAGAPISVFATDPSTAMTSKGLAWPLDGVKFPNLYCATLNRAEGGSVEITASHPSFVFLPSPKYKNFRNSRTTGSLA